MPDPEEDLDAYLNTLKIPNLHLFCENNNTIPNCIPLDTKSII